jgi:phosphate transport system permease protein
MILVLGLFILARVVGGRGPGQLTPRQSRRIVHASAEDIARIEARAHAPSSETGALHVPHAP